MLITEIQMLTLNVGQRARKRNLPISVNKDSHKNLDQKLDNRKQKPGKLTEVPELLKGVSNQNNNVKLSNLVVI